MKKLYTLAALLLVSGSTFAQTQWASYLIDFSSEYHVEADSICNTTWAACQILGEPNVYPIYSDHGGAWSPSSADDQREFIAVGFDSAMAIDGVYVYETLNTGAVDSVYVRNAATGAWNLVWSDSAEVQDNTAKVLFATFPMTSYLVDGVRLAVNSPAVPGYNEIDAISVGGFILSDNNVAATETLLTVYPNPSNGSFTLNAGHVLVERIAVKDVTGREVYNLENLNESQVKIDRAFPSGIYMVVATGNGFKKSVKLVVE
ncbi:MAG TPA: T9SS type A sorting domain-containing protein [Chitinophagales bacterium]|nr:T9SS type A sorting domain-containing protein [Chitinophagales bacterium]